MAEHKIILASVTPGSEGAVTTALAKVLGQSEDGVRPIVSSVPIILLDGLEAGQAQAIAAAMANAKQAGGNLVVSAAPGQNMPHVDWPVTPKVAGRDIASFKAAAAPARPPSSAQRIARPASPTSAAVPAATITCPHCRKTIALHASPAGPGARAGIRRVPVSEALQVPAPAGEVGEVGKALPEVPNVQGHVESPPPAASLPTTPMDLEEFERGVGGGGPLHHSGETLLQQLDKALDQPSPSPSPPKGKPKAKKPPSPSAGPPGRTRPRSPGGAAERLRGRDRKRRR